MSIDSDTLELPAVPEPRDGCALNCTTWLEAKDADNAKCSCRLHIMWCDGYPPCGCPRRVA